MDEKLEKYYAMIHGDYEGTMKRLGSGFIIRKYLFKMRRANYFTAFKTARAAHNEKGILEACHNLMDVSAVLGLTLLFQISNKICACFYHECMISPIDEYAKILAYLYADTMELMTILEDDLN